LGYSRIKVGILLNLEVDVLDRYLSKNTPLGSIMKRYMPTNVPPAMAWTHVLDGYAMSQTDIYICHIWDRYWKK